MAYPKRAIAAAWQQILLNQFHDILPGTSIPQVYEDANLTWQAVQDSGAAILEDSLRAIANQINLPEPPINLATPIFVFNSLNWQRSHVVTVPLPPQDLNDYPAWSIYDLDGNPLPCQMTDGQIQFLPLAIPSVGYRVFWLAPGSKGTKTENRVLENCARENWTLENQFLRITVDELTGEFSSIFDKVNQQEILGDGGGNQLQGFQDKGHDYWDAWNIDPHYEQNPLAPPTLKSLTWQEQGPVRQRLRVVRQLGQSEFCQDYILDVDSPLIQIKTKVDWHDRHTLVKAAFPLNLEATHATYEIACGAIQRRTLTPEDDTLSIRDRTKWEVPALRWADLTPDPDANHPEPTCPEPTYGVSLLNDCKYGYDARPNQLRLTLLKSPNWPDPNADRGHHEFTYALYPHSHSWQQAHTVRRGYELNTPLLARTYPDWQTFNPIFNPVGPGPVGPGDLGTRGLAPVGCFIDLSAENLVLMALKQAEDLGNGKDLDNGEQGWILRCYEAQGQGATLQLQGDLDWVMGGAVNLLERSDSKLSGDNTNATANATSNATAVDLYPWQIGTFTVKPRSIPKNPNPPPNTVRLKIPVPLLGGVRGGFTLLQRSQTHPPAPSQEGEID